MSVGKVWKYGNDINTDVIFPGKYTYSISLPKEMALHALENLDPDFVQKVKPGDIIVAGRNFGCGSSREQAAICLKYAGIQAVIAKSFARIFFRNAINQGLPVVICRDAAENIKQGDEVEIDFSRGRIVTKKGTYDFVPFSGSVLEILNEGGLIPYTRKKLKGEKGEEKREG